MLLLKKLIGVEYVDCAVDCVGYEAHGTGGNLKQNEIAAALNECITSLKFCGHLGILGVYLNQDPGAKDKNETQGILGVKMGDIFVKGISAAAGQCPVNVYNAKLMNLILSDRFHIAKALKPVIYSLEDAPEAYKHHDQGSLGGGKAIFDPHGMIKKLSKQ